MDQFEDLGACLIPQALSSAALHAANTLVDAMLSTGSGGRAFTLSEPIAAELIKVATGLAQRPARPVRVLAFDKTPDANWGVPWHQDRTIAVNRRVEISGFGPWSVKAGVPHVEPPEALLAAMFCLRLHLDACDADNGPLKIIPGSHRKGRLSVQEVRALAGAAEAMVCAAEAGDIVAMKGLAVHASEPARSPAHRRVLHVDFATMDLPGPLEWAIAA